LKYGLVNSSPDDVFTAFRLTPHDDVKVLLLGQDPYPTVHHAHGLCFSVRPGVRIPGSLVNMFKELQTEYGCSIPNNGYLVPWAEQGVLLLNAVLTVREGAPNSHANKGWEKFTDAVIKALNDRDDPVVFALWGSYAQKKAKLIDEGKHRVLKAAHPSPLSVKLFMGSKPFSQINNALEELGKKPIDWQIPDI
jgi:uracil-DNA glycosylase